MVKWIVRIYSLILLGYTGWRTFDFMQMQIPVDEKTGTVLALLFLFTTEAGLLLWHEVSIQHCSTDVQYNIATGLTWLDFGASFAAGIADMILRQTFFSGYEIPPLLGTILLYGLPAVVALNVAGVFLWQANDSEVQKKRAEQVLRHEIHRRAMRDLMNSSEAIAERLKGGIADRIASEIIGDVQDQYSFTGSKKSLETRMDEAKGEPAQASPPKSSTPKRKPTRKKGPPMTHEEKLAKRRARARARRLKKKLEQDTPPPGAKSNGRDGDQPTMM